MVKMSYAWLDDALKALDLHLSKENKASLEEPYKSHPVLESLKQV